MLPNPKTALRAGLFLAWLLATSPARAITPTIDWHYVGQGAPTTAFSSSPVTPGPFDAITLLVPTDGFYYVNSCFASAEKGYPALAVNPTTHTIDISFAGRPSVCPLIALPVSGLELKFGPLPPGLWTVNTPFNLPYRGPYWFNVTATPLPPSAPSLQITPAASAVLLSWPVTSESYLLESTQDPTQGNWQPVDLPPTVSGNQNQLLLPMASGGRFFRLTYQP